MLEKIIADFSRAIDLLSGGITWIILGAVGGVAVEWETARAYPVSYTHLTLPTT